MAGDCADGPFRSPARSSAAPRAEGEVCDRIFDAYVPRGVLHHLAQPQFSPVRTVDGTMLFADLSGFTRLSERLARLGPEGAELLVELINSCFLRLARVAYDNGGSLVKFGGDALLLFFEGDLHARRACRAAVRMRERLRADRRVEVAGLRGVLRISLGVHTDAFHFLLVGNSHLEHLVLGPGATGVVRAEAAAGPGRIVVSARTAALLPAGCLGPPAGPGRLLRRSPLQTDVAAVGEALQRPPDEVVGRVLSTAVRAHVLGAGSGQAEHRRASVAFLRFGGTDAVLAAGGPAALAEAAAGVVCDAQEAADEHGVCFLDSDVDADGGKLLLTAGAPRVVGDDEERMLLTLRQILDRQRDSAGRLTVAIGVNRGPVFTGEIGPPFRRAYIVMGDTTNLAARVAAKAPPGELWATAGILERSRTRFSCRALEPFAAKGKSRPVQAWSVGAPLRARAAAAPTHALPFVGRDAELAGIETALAAAADGRGALVEVVGEPGIGKTRLAEEARGRVRAASPAATVLRAGCEAYTAGVPYAPWHVLLRGLLGLGWAASPAQAWAALQATCAARDPQLLPWTPLLADALGVEAPATPEVAALAPEFRRERLHEAVLRFLGPDLDRPVHAEIENAQHMDEASAALLAALAPALPGSRWVVLVTRRPGRSPLGARPGVVRIALGPLDGAAARALADAVADAHPLPPHLLAGAVERSGGNPQFLLDLLAAGADGELPDSAQAAAMAQIDALAPGDRALVRHASVLGSGFAPSQLAAFLARDPAELGPSTWARLAAVFDATSPYEVRFRRAAVREAAYAALPFRERRALHAAAARVLTAGAGGPAGSPGADPAILALHHRAAGEHAQALGPALRAAERAMARAAPADAAGLYRAALASAVAVGTPEAELADIWADLGGALRRAGESAAADRAFREARRRVPDDPLRQAELYFRQARLAHRAGRGRASVRWARAGLRALDGVPAGTDPAAVAAWRARLTMSEAADRLRQGRTADAIRLCRRAMAEAECGSGPVAERAMAHACYILDWALVDAGRPAEAVHSGRALQIYDRLGDLEDKANVLNNLGMFAYWEGRWDDAVRLYLDAADLAGRVGDAMGVAYGDCNVGEVHSDQGDWDSAEACLQRALRRWRGTGDEAGCAYARMQLGRLAARRGEHAAGRRLLGRAVEELRALGLDDAVVAEAYAAEAAAYAGDPGAALAAVERLLGEAAARHVPLLLRVRALASAREGPEAVARQLREALAAARREGADYDAAVTLDALCRLGLGDPGERDVLFRRLGIRRLATPPLPGI